MSGTNTKIADIATAATGGTTPVQNTTFQTYTYTFTATAATEDVSFLFSNNTGYTALDAVSLVGGGGTNLMTNGNFELDSGPSTPRPPTDWTTVEGTDGQGTPGQIGHNGGGSIDPGFTTADGTTFFVDGVGDSAGGATVYDALSQQVSGLTSGTSYTLSFQLGVDPSGSPDTGAPSDGIDTQVWVGSTTQVPPCFCRGTRILTATGETAVESLQIGDLVATASGQGGVMKPIVWIGRSPYDAERHPRPDQVWPVRILEGALGDGLPRRDLVVSPGHSLLLDGVLMPAECLVNGATIIRDTAMPRGDYFHVELASHDILLSEGVPSESYLNTGNRSAFVNSGGVVDLHPDFGAHLWTDTCLPLVLDGPILAAARDRLSNVARTLGWKLRDEAAAPHLLVNGVVVQPARQDGKRASFTIPGAANSIRLVSRSAIPAESLLGTGDGRRLGLVVSGFAVIRNGIRQALALDDPAFVDGWHAVEQEAGSAWRWTDGNAGIVLAGPCELEFCVESGVAHWDAPMAEPQPVFALAG